MPGGDEVVTTVRAVPSPLRVSRTIAAPRDTTWALLTDTDQWSRWAPSITGADLDGVGSVLTAGATGHVRLPGGVSLPFRVTRFEPGGCWEWTVARVPATGHEVRGPDGGPVEVAITVPWWAAPYALVCRIALHRLARVAEGIDAPVGSHR